MTEWTAVGGSARILAFGRLKLADVVVGIIEIIPLLEHLLRALVALIVNVVVRIQVHIAAVALSNEFLYKASQYLYPPRHNSSGHTIYHERYLKENKSDCHLDQR